MVEAKLTLVLVVVGNLLETAESYSLQVLMVSHILCYRYCQLPVKDCLVYKLSADWNQCRNRSTVTDHRLMNPKITVYY